MNAIHKILVPTDFSPHADEAFRVAQTLARSTGADIVLFHVARPPTVVTEGGRILAHADSNQAVDLWERFHRLQPTDPAVRVEHQAIVVERPTAGHILELLDRQGCDLIVMGMHGHSWLRHRLLGSFTEDVVRRARCPVMVVKAPTQPHEAPASGTAEAAADLEAVS
jgi:nucleotide-binding universal stress UspA family protein